MKNLVPFILSLTVAFCGMVAFYYAQALPPEELHYLWRAVAMAAGMFTVVAGLLAAVVHIPTPAPRTLKSQRYPRAFLE